MIILGLFPTILSFFVYLVASLFLFYTATKHEETERFLFWKKTFLYVFFFDISCFILFDISSSALRERVFGLIHLMLPLPLFIRPKAHTTIHKEAAPSFPESALSIFSFEPLQKTKDIEHYTFSRPLKAQILSTSSKIRLREAGAPHSILITGETGVGKKTCARLIADKAEFHLYEFLPDSNLSESELESYIHSFFSLEGAFLFTDIEEFMGWKQVRFSSAIIELFRKKFFESLNSKEKLVIATSSNLYALEENFKSLFMLFFEIPLPGKHERRRLIESFLDEFSLKEEINIDGFVELTESRTTKDIVKLFKKIKEEHAVNPIGRHELASALEKLLQIPA